MANRLLIPLFVGCVGATAITGLCSVPATNAKVTSGYQVTDLGIPQGFLYSNAVKINDTGTAVGFVGKDISYIRAVAWRNGTKTDLGTLGGTSSSALDINSQGQVVGYANTKNKSTRAVLWRDGKKINLGTLDGSNSPRRISLATSINKVGVVVGFSSPKDPKSGSVRATVWRDGRISDLGTLNGGSSSVANSINNQGVVVGSSTINSSTSSPQSHAVLWDANGRISDLGVLEGNNSSAANRINNKGQVVGVSYTNNGSSQSNARATLWSQGKITNLGNLGGEQGSYAYDINDAGIIVGRSSTKNGGTHAFVWRNGQITDLNSLIPANSGWKLEFALGINYKGQIVGVGEYNGEIRAFLLKPAQQIQ